MPRGPRVRRGPRRFGTFACTARYTIRTRRFRYSWPCRPIVEAVPDRPAPRHIRDARGTGSVSVGSPLGGTASLCYHCVVSAPPRARLSASRPLRSRILAAASVPRTRRTFARLNKPLDVPNLIDIQRRSFEWLTEPDQGRAARDDRRHLADRGLHRQPRRAVRRVRLRRAGRADRRVPREGPHLRAPADGHGRLHQPRDRRDPRAVRLHGRLPVDDRARHVHHQRDRARRRDAAGAFARAPT